MLTWKSDSAAGWREVIGDWVKREVCWRRAAEIARRRCWWWRGEVVRRWRRVVAIREGENVVRRGTWVLRWGSIGKLLFW